MNKKYIEIDQDSKQEYLMYKNFCESKSLKPVKYDLYYSECAISDLKKVLGVVDEINLFEKIWSIHGIKYKSSYNHPNNLGKWTTAFEVIDQELLEKSNLFKHYSYITEERVKNRKESFQNNVNEFWGDD